MSKSPITCTHAKDVFREWLCSGSPSCTEFRKWCHEYSKNMFKKTGMKGFMTLEFDQPEDAIIYTISPMARNGAYTIIKDKGIPPQFKSIYDSINMDTHFLLYVVFGKNHPDCLSLMREVQGDI